jgi:hypothetical protein
LLRIGSIGAFGLPSLQFAGESVELTGTGTLELGLVPGRPAMFAAPTTGGRIFNGPNHTIRTTGLRSGRIGAYVQGSVQGNAALTNEGTILAEDRAVLGIQLNQDLHFNSGTIGATSRGTLVLSSSVGGTFRNSELVFASGISSEIQLYRINVANEATGELRASDRGSIAFHPLQPNSVMTNAGLIEAVDNGFVRVNGHLINEPQSTVRTATGGYVFALSRMTVGGILTGSGRIESPFIDIGGTISPGSGIGTMPLVGEISFASQSRFIAELGPLDADLLQVTGNLRFLDGSSELQLSGGNIGRSYVIGQYTGERVGTFDSVTPGYDVIYDDVAKQIRVTVVPETGGLGLAVVALIFGGAVAVRRRMWRMCA